MCGLVAIVGNRFHEPGIRVKKMLNRISHRGPDELGIKVFDGCTLGHVRLSIIDLKSGAQPITDLSERFWIVFNGELYNFNELRDQLIKTGWQFKTNSDTEIVLLCYIQWGKACLDLFRGMFAFAIWDDEKKELFAARDIFGEKPFFYAVLAGGNLLLASEIKGLLASESISPEIDLSSIDAYLALGYIPPDRTVYQNISTLPPGHYLLWRTQGIEVGRYWLPKPREEVISLANAAEETEALLFQAVRRQMVADVPVGAFLSGGLDSSTIVALMSAQSKRPIMTFSAGFGKHINELPYARAVAEKYQTEHHELDFGEPDVAGLLEMMVGIYDEPFADSSSIPTYLISKFASEKVKVILSGDGGDELFGGYWWHRIMAQSESLEPSMTKWFLLRIASKLLRDQNQRLAQYSVALGWRTRHQDSFYRGVAAQVTIPWARRQKLWGKRSIVLNWKLNDNYYKPGPEIHGLNRSFQFDLLSYLPGNILVKLDRAAMANSLETRAPFLDRDLVEYALTIPWRLKVSSSESKIVLREACAKFWPEELRRRNKQGFGSPYTAWFQRADMVALCKKIFAPNGRLRKLLPGIPSDQTSRHTYETWVLLCLGLWLEKQEIAL
jgi:asparagine synthase (glutamine-hydrolysing)